ncbi:MAG TPA: DnaJ family domain-containing protein [Verrucomicrobiae bacterium]|nr:DnaJ family domain-containing protein [Verrucomicrobiae bacterium]
MDVFATIAERKIREAMERGELDDLPGKGKPLAMDDGMAGVPAEIRMAYRIMKNAGFVPPEVELAKEIATLRNLVDALEDDGEKRRRTRELNFKLMKLSMLRNRPLDLEESEYGERVARRLCGG